MSALETVKKVKNAVLLKDSKGELFIRIDNCRLAYPFLGKIKEDKDEKTGKIRSNWRLVAMLDKKTHVEAKALVKEVIEGLVAKNEAKVPKSNWFLQDGNEKEGEEMQGQFLVSASDGKVPPKIRDRKGNQIERDEAGVAKIDEMFYGGCWASVLIRPWYFSGKAKNDPNTYPKRVSAGLVGALFSKDDTPFGSGRVDETDAWAGAVTDDDGDGDGMGGEDNDDEI